MRSGGRSGGTEGDHGAVLLAAPGHRDHEAVGHRDARRERHRQPFPEGELADQV